MPYISRHIPTQIHHDEMDRFQASGKSVQASAQQLANHNLARIIMKIVERPDNTHDERERDSFGALSRTRLARKRWVGGRILRLAGAIVSDLYTTAFFACLPKMDFFPGESVRARIRNPYY